MSPTTKYTARFCPKCGSPALHMVALLNEATCEACHWNGHIDELKATEFEHDMGSDSNVVEIFVKQLRNLFTKSVAVPLGLLLMKWGFISSSSPPEEMKKHICMYMEAAARSVAISLIETRRNIEIKPNALLS